MSILDLILSLILLFSLIVGMVRGLIKSISWLPGLILGLLAVCFFNKDLALLISKESTLSPMLSSLSAVLLLMTGTYIVVRIVLVSVSNAFKDTGLGVIDKVLGALFSLALALIGIGLICSILDSISALEGVKRAFDSSFIVNNIVRPFYNEALQTWREIQ